jgi:hypothetical protein
VFDVAIRAEHEQQLVTTQNPVQTGAAITDNAYIVPAKLTIEIAMSDSMQSYTVGQFASAPSRSVSAYQTLLALQSALTPMSVATRLRNYTNMLIREIHSNDVDKTRYGLRAKVVFEQIITASGVTISSSSTNNPTPANPQSATQTLTGSVPVQSVPPSIQSQNNIANTYTGLE